MWKKAFHTQPDIGALVLRVVLGLVVFPHGAQKLFGWFGGPGFQGAMDQFAARGIPAPLAFLIIIGETLGAASIVAGFATRLCALWLGAGLVVHAMLHASHGFFLNWTHSPGVGHGFEFHLLAIGIAAAVAIKGGGSWSADRAIFHGSE